MPTAKALQNTLAGTFLLMIIPLIASAQEKPKTDSILDYLVDVAAGPVSASNLTGVSKSAITNVQTSQDLVLVLGTLMSNDSKKAFGLSITPARTSFSPMSGADYLSHRWVQVLANFTVSYAENVSAISNVDYKKSAYSIDTYWYYDQEQDPVILGYRGFDRCDARKIAERTTDRAGVDLQTATAARDKLVKQGQPETILKLEQDKIDVLNATYAKLKLLEAGEQKACDKAAQLKSKWNDARFSLSYGEARIEPDKGGKALSMGRSLAISAIYPLGKQLGLFGTYRRSQDVLDIKTMATVPVFKSSNLMALRIASEDNKDATRHWLLEASNAGESQGAAGTSTFKRAIGLDKKMADGMWLQLRYGKSTSSDGTTTENKGTFNLAIVPTVTSLTK